VFLSTCLFPVKKELAKLLLWRVLLRNFIRDIFVFVCFTALSFIDVKNLTTDNIVNINGDKWIISKRHKTNIPFQVKLMDVPLQIINRYKYLQEDKLVFGKMRSTFGRLACPRITGRCARS